MLFTAVCTIFIVLNIIIQLCINIIWQIIVRIKLKKKLLVIHSKISSTHFELNAGNLFHGRKRIDYCRPQHKSCVEYYAELNAEHFTQNVWRGLHTFWRFYHKYYTVFRFGGLSFAWAKILRLLNVFFWLTMVTTLRIFLLHCKYGKYVIPLVDIDLIICKR